MGGEGYQKGQDRYHNDHGVELRRQVPEAYDGWSWHTNIDVRFHPPTNANASDPGKPVARIRVTVSGSVKTYEHDQHVEWGFTLYGNGDWSNDT